MPAVSGGQRFSIVQAWAVDDERMSGAALRMLVLLGTYSNPEGWSWPSQEELGGRLGGISKQAVSKTIQELHTLGYIEIRYYGGNNGFRQKAKYRLIMDQPIPEQFNRRVQWTAIKEAEEAGRTPANPGGPAPVNLGVDREMPQSTPRLTANQPPGLPAVNPPVDDNVPNRTNPKNVPNPSPTLPAAAPPASRSAVVLPSSKRQAELSRDGRTHEEWVEAFKEGCYRARGVPDDLEKKDIIALAKLRLAYPVDVIIAYHNHLKAQPFFADRQVTIYRLGHDIGEWGGLKGAMRAWEKGNAVDSGSGAAGGGADRGGDGGEADPWDDPRNADLLGTTIAPGLSEMQRRAMGQAAD